MHQIRDQYTGVDDNKESVVKSYSLAAYPNPLRNIFLHAEVRKIYKDKQDYSDEIV